MNTLYHKVPPNQQSTQSAFGEVDLSLGVQSGMTNLRLGGWGSRGTKGPYARGAAPSVEPASPKLGLRAQTQHVQSLGRQV